MARLRMLRLAVLLALLVVAARLVEVQVFEAPRYAASGRSQLTTVISIPALRGGIYDRDGNVLALSVPTKEVIADDFQVRHPIDEAARLAPLLGMSPASLAPELHQPRGYVVLASQLPENQASRVAAGNFPGITLEDSSRRYAPEGSLAGSVLGGLDSAGRGVAGLELQYQKLLAGRSGRTTVLQSPTGVALPGTATTSRPKPLAGSSIELTLDEPLQYVTEQALGSEILASHATSGIAVVMDVRSGQILSMANLVAGSGGSVSQASSNLAVTRLYEPGSVFKIVTFSAALQDGVVTPGTPFTVPGALTLDGTTFHDAEAHGTEQLTATQILAQSSNIGTSEIAQQVGEARLLAQVANMGFGRPTGLGFPGESSGILVTPAQWEPTDIVDLPIGQVDAVSAQQVLDMVNAVADGGTLVQPKLVRAVIGPNGSVKATAPSPRRQVMAPSVAAELDGMMQQVVTAGTGTLASVPGYSVAGKTGTSQVPDPTTGGFIPGVYDATFAGFAPANHPVLSAVVVLDRPTPYYGGSVSAPVFSQIMSYALHRYSIPTSPGASSPAPPPGSGTSQTQNVT